MKPLEGIKVVEMATVVAAPTAGRVMCDFGAEVIKVETLFGDELRRAGSSFSLPCEDDDNPMFTAINSNKKIIPLNLKSEKGKEILFKLLADADVLISNIRLASLARLGLDYESVKERFPRLVYALFSGYGTEGPEGNSPGFDITAFWLRNGAMNDWKENGTFPMNPSYAFGDVATSNALLSGILMGLLGRELTGKGTLVTTSLMASGIWCNFTDIISSQPQFGRDKVYDKYHQTDPFSALYKCADGKYIGIYCNEYESDKERLAKFFGIEEILEDERYASVESLHKTGAIREGIEKVGNVISEKTSKEWNKILLENNISNEIARTASDVAVDKQAIENGYIEMVKFAGSNTVMMPTPPMRFSEFDRHCTTPTRSIGAFTDEILASVGYSTDEIEDMKVSRIIV